jgi:hemolysin activation/secretion protein
MGADNTGTLFTDRNRLFFGFNFGKTLLKDGQISYQYTCSPNWNVFYAHTASARLPLPWRHMLIFYGGYTQIDEPIDFPDSREKGYSWQVDGRYRIPIFSHPHLMQEFIIGYDFKEANEKIRQDKTTVFDANADISQFMLGYELGFRNQNQRLSFAVEVFGSPGGLTPYDSNGSYRLLRPGAESRYLYGKASHSLASEFPYCWLTYDLSGQASTTNLLPSEQFTLSGYSAVRGYEERILNVDNAFLMNLGIETPHWGPMKALGVCEMRDELYFLAFFDYGVGGNHQFGPSFCQLASVGPGIRYQMDRYFTLRFDYGFQLWHSGFDNLSDSRYNFGMILSY